MNMSTLPPFILQELPGISDSINEPLKNAQRIKYTCFDVSKAYIVFGATSGGIFVFNRWPCDLIQLIPSKDGPITRLSISPDEKNVAYANGKGIVTVISSAQLLSNNQINITSKEHQDNEVTAMIWSHDVLFIGDDVGRISILQVSNFITKTIFTSSSQTIISLESRICQLDIRECWLLVSTLTRCYICDTSKEQYRQIGQKLRDGEYGACFVTTANVLENCPLENHRDIMFNKYNMIVNNDSDFSASELKKYLIFSARPSSRLWEATIDGSVRCTHQYKQVLARSPFTIITIDSYRNETVNLEFSNTEYEAQSCNFPKLYNIYGTIFSFTKEALYFLNTQNVEYTLWFDKYKDIMDCKVVHDNVYVWLQDGSIINLKFMNIEKYLVKCFLDAKYVLCAEFCALYTSYLLSECCLSNNLYILAGLSDKLPNHRELLTKISKVLEKYSNITVKEIQTKSGIYVVDNTYRTQSVLDNELCHLEVTKPSTPDCLNEFGTDKKHRKEQSSNLEELDEDSDLQTSVTKSVENIVYKESSEKPIILDDNTMENEKICKLLYQQYKLKQTSNECEGCNVNSTLKSYSCDIMKIYQIMLLLEQYCISINALDESKHAPYSIFLNYINDSNEKSDILNKILQDECLYIYFVDSCISVNTKMQKLSDFSCKCGFPMPFTRYPFIEYSELIDLFIEKQWLSESKEKCYEMCKRMPYLWRNILFLRKNENLNNILKLLLQMLDENLLCSFLPQFSTSIWERTIELYANLNSNICLNCFKKFSYEVNVKNTLSWDGLGALMTKSVGAKTAVALFKKYTGLINPGELTMKFYHTCLLVHLFEKYDSLAMTQLIDTVYAAYEFEDAKNEICKLLRSIENGRLKNTSLPIIVAAKSSNWGLRPFDVTTEATNSITIDKVKYVKDISFNEILVNISSLCNGVTDCSLCGLPLVNDVLIKDGGLCVFRCGHVFHGACLNLNKVKLCTSCVPIVSNAEGN